MSEITSSSEVVYAPRQMEQIRARIRCKHDSIRTGLAYTDWIKFDRVRKKFSLRTRNTTSRNVGLQLISLPSRIVINRLNYSFMGIIVR